MVSEVEAEEAAEEACFKFLLFSGLVISRAFSTCHLGGGDRGGRGGGRGGGFGGRGGARGIFLPFTRFLFHFTLVRFVGGGVEKRGSFPRGRGGPGRGGRGGGRGGAKTILEPHRHAGIFIAKAKESMLVTKNLVPGESVYGEKRISIEGAEPDTKVEYRVWNPFRSKLAAGVLGGLDNIFIAPGKKVLYLGAASGTSVSHVADIVGPVRLSWFTPDMPN